MLPIERPMDLEMYDLTRAVPELPANLMLELFLASNWSC
jgi:hypothetical protein